MEVIFDGALLKPVLSPTMKTALSVISLIANSLVEANKCMKKRLADEAGQPSTLDEVMKQSGLNIPGLEEALARLMGGGDEARKAAAMVVNTPDPADLLRAFVRTYGVEPAPTKPPIVKPWAATSPSTAPSTVASETATAPAPPSAAGLPLFRPDFTREAREAARAKETPAAPSQPAAATPPVKPATPWIVARVERRLGELSEERRASAEAMDRRIDPLVAELAALRAELNELREAAREPGQSSAAESAKVADGVGAEPAAPVLSVVEGLTQEAVALTVTVAEVDQAIGLIDDYAREARAADEQQFARIAALEHDLASMRAQVRQEREAQRARAAHA
ncbi:MAG: hypothetical protein JNK56_20405 [Myxococcales bacterium]|nr:hypothetical protein [Myxococcales bacterium]